MKDESLPPVPSSAAKAPTAAEIAKMSNSEVADLVGQAMVDGLNKLNAERRAREAAGLE